MWAFRRVTPDQALVLRLDFSHPNAWQSIRAEIEKPVGPFGAHVEFLHDPQFEGIRVEQQVSMVSEGTDHSIIFVVDEAAMAHPDHSILAIDRRGGPGRTIRMIPSEMWAVENNLPLTNGRRRFACQVPNI